MFRKIDEGQLLHEGWWWTCWWWEPARISRAVSPFFLFSFPHMWKASCGKSQVPTKRQYTTGTRVEVCNHRQRTKQTGKSMFHQVQYRYILTVQDVPFWTFRRGTSISKRLITQSTPTVSSGKSRKETLWVAVFVKVLAQIQTFSLITDLYWSPRHSERIHHRKPTSGPEGGRRYCQKIEYNIMWIHLPSPPKKAIEYLTTDWRQLTLQHIHHYLQNSEQCFLLSFVAWYYWVWACLWSHRSVLEYRIVCGA